MDHQRIDDQQSKKNKKKKRPGVSEPVHAHQEEEIHCKRQKEEHKKNRADQNERQRNDVNCTRPIYPLQYSSQQTDIPVSLLFLDVCCVVVRRFCFFFFFFFFLILRSCSFSFLRLLTLCIRCQNSQKLFVFIGYVLPSPSLASFLWA